MVRPVRRMMRPVRFVRPEVFRRRHVPVMSEVFRTVRPVRPVSVRLEVFRMVVRPVLRVMRRRHFAMMTPNHYFHFV